MINAITKFSLSFLILSCAMTFISQQSHAVPVNWTRLSSSTGELPAPPVNDGQSGLRIIDLDNNGENDYVLTLWNADETVVWYRQTDGQFEKYTISTNTPNLSHGERFQDIDNDGDIDLVFGDASLGNRLYWWENPSPIFDPDTPWTRRIIRSTGGNFYHDNIWGDFDGDGDNEFMSWNQLSRKLLLFDIPLDPKLSDPWPVTEIFTWSGEARKYRGADAIDINLDGQIDFVGGCSWFEFSGGSNFIHHPIDESHGYSQVKAGQLIAGGRPEVVCLLERESGQLNMYEWTGTEWQANTIVENMPESHTLQMGDVDADGHLDIVTGNLALWESLYPPLNNPNATLSVFYGDGAGNFLEQHVFVGQGDLEGQLADIDNDGDLDIIAKPFRQDRPRIDFWLNQGTTPVSAVPNLTNLTQAEAESDLLSAGLDIGVISTGFSESIPYGSVIAQQPFPGLNVLTPSPVNIQVSVGPGAYQENFNSYSAFSDPANWLDTAADNSLVENNDLYQTHDLNGESVLGTLSAGSNTHSHYSGTQLTTLNAYEYSGRLMITNADSGIGVTFFSDYPASDKYYRLRRYKNAPSFHLSAHGTSLDGDMDSGISPMPNVWYRFRIQVEDQISQTEIRARIWTDNQNEPLYWQMQAVDSTATHLTAGTVGVWSYLAGGKYWDDLIVGPLSPANTAEIPDVSGLTQNQAETDIINTGFSLGSITDSYDDNIPIDQIISQNPSAGTTAALGTQVNLVISLGQAALIDVPDLTGLTLGQAQTTITSAGLTLNTVENAYSDSVAVGLVLDQSPSPGNSAPLSSPVNLVLSSGTSFLLQDFTSSTAGSDPINWQDSAANSSLTEDDSLFKVLSVNNDPALGTSSTAPNIHSHLSDGSLEGLSGYEFSGRLMISSTDSGIGLTFFSQYPDQDAYYRIRRYGNNPAFHLSPHGTTVSGDTNSDVSPVSNQWYNFRIQVEDNGNQTEIRAKIWAGTEPDTWQIDAIDSSSTRLTSGTVGVWSYSTGSKYWDNFAVNPLQTIVNVAIPDLTGLTQLQAESSISAAGLVVGTIENAYHDSIALGNVISQSPIAGATATTGATVDIVVSQGPVTMINVPDFTGISLTQAEALMASSDLSLGMANYIPDDTVSAGIVLDQTPSAGTSVISGSTIDLIVSAGTSYVTENFETGAINTDPADWIDTAANNSLSENNSLFKILAINDTQALGTLSTDANIHSHYTGDNLNALHAYEYSGRTMITSNASGIGITFFSQYPQSDAYYRLRRYGNNPTFHISSHGTSANGNTDSGIAPIVGQWYRFRIQVEDNSNQTDIRAKVWQEDEAEPDNWQITAIDSSATRLTSGTVGVWSYNVGSKFWDELTVAPIVTSQ